MVDVRVVPDTNVYVSGLLWSGVSHHLLRLAEAGELICITTPSIMEELRDVLGRPKFRLRIATLDTSVAELMESLLSIVEVVKIYRSSRLLRGIPTTIKFWPVQRPGKPNGSSPETTIF